MANFMCVAVIAFFCAAAYVQASEVKSLRDLRRELFQDYDKKVRPVKRYSTQVLVSVSMTPLAVKSLDTKEHVIVLDTWIMMKWTDEYLRWDPSEYDNITQLRVPSEDVWKPDLSLYTATPDTSLFPIVQTQAIAYSTGMVLWVPPFTIKSRCMMRPHRNYLTNKNFVECNIRLGSWTYSGPLMDLQLSTNKVDLTNFGDFNPEWKLVKIDVNRESKHYPCCTEEYPSLNFNITLKRRSNFL